MSVCDVVRRPWCRVAGVVAATAVLVGFGAAPALAAGGDIGFVPNQYPDGAYSFTPGVQCLAGPCDVAAGSTLTVQVTAPEEMPFGGTKFLHGNQQVGTCGESADKTTITCTVTTAFTAQAGESIVANLGTEVDDNSEPQTNPQPPTTLTWSPTDTSGDVTGNNTASFYPTTFGFAGGPVANPVVAGVVLLVVAGGWLVVGRRRRAVAKVAFGYRGRG